MNAFVIGALILASGATAGSPQIVDSQGEVNAFLGSPFLSVSTPNIDIASVTFTSNSSSLFTRVAFANISAKPAGLNTLERVISIGFQSEVNPNVGLFAVEVNNENSWRVLVSCWDNDFESTCDEELGTVPSDHDDSSLTIELPLSILEGSVIDPVAHSWAWYSFDVDLWPTVGVGDMAPDCHPVLGCPRGADFDPTP